MKKILVLTTLLVGATIFSGCGSDDDSSSPAGSSNSDLSISPVTTKVVCDPKALTSNAGSYDVKYSADGDVTVMCQTSGQYTFGEYQLASGLNTLTITQLKRVENFAVDSTSAKGVGVDTYDYKAGTVHHTADATVDGKPYKYNCVETFPSPLPETLTDTNSIENLLEWEGDENNLIKTTCPKSYYEEDDDSEDDNLGKGTINSLINYTLTDSDGKKHLLSVTTSYVLK